MNQNRINLPVVLVRKNYLFLLFLSFSIFLGGCSVMLKITAPTQAVIVNTLKPTFSWTFPYTTGVTYNVIIAEDPTFSTNPKEFVVENEMSLRLSIPYLKRGKKYFWSVKATYNDPKVGQKTTGWVYENPDSKTPYAFIVSQNAIGDFGFEEGQKEELNKQGSLENIRRITFDDKDEWAPSVSKDGKKLAYCSDRLGNTEIFVKILSEGGTGEIQRTFSSPGQNNFNPFWMNDNENFTFYTNRITPNAYNLFETTKGKGLTARQTSNSFIGPIDELTGTCMDNDKKVVYTEKTNSNPDPVLWFLNLNENSYTQLVPGLFPDMRNEIVVFCSNKSGNYDIWTMRMEGNSIYDETQLTNFDGMDYQPSWSPDGERIAFVSHRSGNSDIWVMDADGQNPTQVTFHPMADLYPRWVDNENIIFQSNREKNKKGAYGRDIWKIYVPKRK